MTTYLAAFFLSTLICAVVTPLVLRLAIRRGWYDMPDDRKVHVRPTPRIGGIAIVLAFFAPITGLLLVDSGVGDTLKSDANHIIGLFAGGLSIAALGLFDDIRGADAKQKLFVQIGVAAMMFSFGYKIDIISNPFGGTIDLGFAALPLTVLWYIGVINAVNLIDGLDGLAAGVALIAVSTLAVIALLGGNQIPVLFCCGLGGALVGFLFYNFNPARIFMGDTGSMFLGFVLATLSISASLKGPTTVALVVPLLALGVPTLDTLLAMARRIRNRRPIFSADREHIHHQLLASGLTTRQAVLLLYVIAILFGLSAIVMRVTSNMGAGLVLLAVALLTFVLLRLLARSQAPRLQQLRTLAWAASRDTIRAFAQRLKTCETPGEFEAAVAGLAVETGVIRVSLQMDGGSGLLHLDSNKTAGDTYEVPLVDAAGETRAHLRLSVAARGGEDPIGLVLPWELASFALAQRFNAVEWSPLQGLLDLGAPDDEDNGGHAPAVIRLPPAEDYLEYYEGAEVARIRTP